MFIIAYTFKTIFAIILLFLFMKNKLVIFFIELLLMFIYKN